MRGKVYERTRLTSTKKDHPRTCGEKSLIYHITILFPGSPPHMRGKVYIGAEWHGMPRITPAHAGKSLSSYVCVVIMKDHPRTCGEKKAHFIIRSRHKGSPPHMRGKVQQGERRAEKLGITPAHAGKRRKRSCRALYTKDHPRTCGEKRYAYQSGTVCLGSPPHMRGKGSISPTPLFISRDHPRTCGEKSILFEDDNLREWITPAHAGKRVKSCE